MAPLHTRPPQAGHKNEEMPITRQHIQVLNKLYECHDSAKFMSGEKFSEEIKWYIERIKKVMQSTGKDELKAVLSICELPAIKESAIYTMYFMAAAVEMLDPGK